MTKINILLLYLLISMVTAVSACNSPETQPQETPTIAATETEPPTIAPTATEAPVNTATTANTNARTRSGSGK